MKLWWEKSQTLETWNDIYGSRILVRVPEVKRSKWNRKADLGVLVGYENVGYRVLLNNKVIIVKHVDIIEENINLVGFKDNDEINVNVLVWNEIHQELQNEKKEKRWKQWLMKKKLMKIMSIRKTHLVLVIQIY